MSTRMLGVGFLLPALIVVMLFFLLPVLLTVVFSFTTMSTATGITGGAYMLQQPQIRRLEAQGVSSETVESLASAGFQITEGGLEAFAAEFGEERAEELREDYFDESFAQRRDLERLLRDLDSEPIRRTRDRKAAAELFAVSIVGTRFATEPEFREALSSTGIAEADHEPLITAAYTGWTWTTENFKLLLSLPSTWQYAMNTVIYVVATLAFNVVFGLFLAISTFYLPQTLASTFRSVWFLPRILPPVMYALMWKWFTWDTGFLGVVSGWFGVAPKNWMMDTALHAWTVVVLINGFVGASLGMILFSSAIKAIPTSMLYASEVDGANRWQQVRYIILPQLRWPILFITSYQTLSLLTSFEYILLSTEGGPGRTTTTWALAAYSTALRNYGGNLEYGFGAAYALALVIIGILMSFLYMRFFNFKELVARPRIEQ